jgi:hypothetical protein
MMINLINQFKEHLQPREDAFRCFCDRGVQVEGWFKGEMLTFLGKERANFDREVKSGQENKKIDFLVKMDSQPTKIELKHWLVGKQKGTSYDARWYFKQGRTPKERHFRQGFNRTLINFLPAMVEINIY